MTAELLFETIGDINEDFVKSLFIQDESLSGSLAEHCKIYLDHLSDFVFKGHFRKRLCDGPLDVRRTHCAARTIAGRDSKDTGKEYYKCSFHNYMAI